MDGKHREHGKSCSWKREHPAKGNGDQMPKGCFPGDRPGRGAIGKPRRGCHGVLHRVAGEKIPDGIVC